MLTSSVMSSVTYMIIKYTHACNTYILTSTVHVYSNKYNNGTMCQSINISATVDGIYSCCTDHGTMCQSTGRSGFEVDIYSCCTGEARQVYCSTGTGKARQVYASTIMEQCVSRYICRVTSIVVVSTLGLR